MLYNPNWNSISLADLIAWLEPQPVDGEYCYQSNGGCLLAQFLTSKGYPDVCVGSYDCHYNWRWDVPFEEAVELKLPRSFYEISVGHPRTYGGALHRAKAVA